jgi:hypothetical protein
MAISQHLIKQLIRDLLKALLIVGHEAGLSLQQCMLTLSNIKLNRPLFAGG